MGFTDFLSRHPSSTPTSVNEDDEKFVVNMIREIKHFVLKQNISPFGASKPTGNSNQSEINTQIEPNDVILAKENTHKIERAFFLSKLINKLLRSLHSNSQNKPQHIAITTRQNRNKNTSDAQTKKRKGAPNKKSPPV